MNIKVYWEVEDPHLPEIISLPTPLQDTTENFEFWDEWRSCVLDWISDTYETQAINIEKV
jgi:hypothetical protein